MSDDARRDEQRDETPGVPRRRFPERTATAGGAALIGAAANVSGAALEEKKKHQAPFS